MSAISSDSLPPRQCAALLSRSKHRKQIWIVALTLLLSVFSQAQTFSFPAVTVPTGSDTKAVLVTFLNGGQIDTVRVTTQGVTGLDYTEAAGGSCAAGMTYSGGQSCTVMVQFAPQAPGVRAGAVELRTGGGMVLGRTLLAGNGSGPLGMWSPAIIDTVAGDGSWIYRGEGNQAKSSPLFLPMGIVVDAAGNLYIADSSNHRVRKVDATTQVMNTIAGTGDAGFSGDGGPATAAMLNNPTSLAIDGSGNLYIADDYNHAIRVIDRATGTIRTLAGMGGLPGYAGDGASATSARLNAPNGLAMDAANGILYIADTGNHAVRSVNLESGKISTVAGTGVAGYSGDGGTATDAMLNAPWGVALGPDGVYIADQNNHRIRRVAAGKISTVVGTGQEGFAGDNGRASAATLRYPAAVMFDVAGNMYISDTGNSRIRKVWKSTGNIATLVGNGETNALGDQGVLSAANVYGPYTLAMDNSGNLYIADMFHNRIRKVFVNQTSLAYPVMRVGRVSATQKQSFENIGNAPMTVTSLQPVSNAALDPATTTCSTSRALASAEICIVGAQFAPQQVGKPITGSIELKSAAINSPSTISLSGEVLTLDPTTVTLTSDANPSALGSNVTLSAKVATSGPNTPTGKITFADGSTTLAVVNMANTVATFTTNALTVGSHTITASYAGDASNNPSVSTALIQVVKETTTTTVTSNLNPSSVKQEVTLTAKVTPAHGSATGNVVFNDGATALGAAPLDGSGIAVLKTNNLTVGSHSVTAAYGGDTGNMPSTSGTLSQVVQKATTATVLTATPETVKAGEPVVLSAKVTGGGLVGVTGSVVFKDGASNLGSANVDGNGIATFTAPSLTGGSHALTAAYLGDTNNGASTSAPITATVEQIATTTLLGADASSLDGGAVLHLTAAVTPSQTTGGALSGIVTFKDGAAVIGTGSVNTAGVAVLNISTLSVAAHSLTAVYGGSASYSGSTSTPITVTVHLATSTAVVTSSVNPVIAGKPVTFTVRVSGSGGIPQGTVTVFSDGGSLGNVSLNASGIATLTTSALSVGSHAITAQYAGDSKNNGATSAALTQVVQQATSAVVLSASANPITTGKPVVLTATVTGNGGVPAGQVTFFDGNSPIATASLNTAGVATYVTSSLTVGTHAMTAAYAGDAQTAAASSNPVSVVVQQATTVSLISSANPAIAGTSVQYTATITGSSPGGTVTFKDGANTLGTATVNGGVALFSTTVLTVGSHSITANYGGDSLNGAAASDALVQRVDKAGTSILLSTSGSPVLNGDQVTLTARVTGNGGALSGAVVFLDGAAIAGTVNVAADGTAVLRTNSLSIGQHTLTARYDGDAKNTSSVSGSQAILVQQQSRVVVVSSANPVFTTDTVVLTATVTNTDGHPTGTVTFLDGAIVLGTQQLSANGVATFTTNSLTAGHHPVAVSYSGDQLNLPSQSEGIDQVVSARPTTTSLTASTTSISYGQNVTLVAVVRGNGPATPTGTVTFSGSAGRLGSAVLDANSVATLTVSPTTSLTGVTATYGGDVLYAVSNSGAVAVAVTEVKRLTMTLDPPTIAMATGQHQTIHLKLASVKGFTDTVQLGCAGLPFAATCTFSSSAVKVSSDGTQMVDVTVDTGHPLGAGTQASMLLPGAGMLGLLAFGARKRRGLLKGLLVLLVLVGVTSGLTGCGALHVNTTPAGTYTVQVTALGTNSGEKQTASLTMTVGQ